MLVHSFIYYKLDDNIVSDHQWQAWAQELAQLQRQHPKPIGFYDDVFVDWDGSSGFHLPSDPWVEGEAQWLLTYHHARLAEGRSAAMRPPAQKKDMPASRVRRIRV